VTAPLFVAQMVLIMLHDLVEGSSHGDRAFQLVTPLLGSLIPLSAATIRQAEREFSLWGVCR
jgi:hypothetical protein